MESTTKGLLGNLIDNKEICRIIVGSLAETISSYTGSATVAGKPYLHSETDKGGVAVAGLIRLEGGGLTVELFLGLSKELFLAIYNNMFSMGAEEIGEDNADMAGEILNIAFGAMDPKFRELGHKFRSSLPQLYFGEGLARALDKIHAEAIAIPFKLGEKSFLVEIYAAGSLGVEWRFEKGQAA